MFWKRENYKDDYYNNLSFVKRMASEMGEVPVRLKSQKKCSNRELLKIMMQDGGYPTSHDARTIEEIRTILHEMLNCLDAVTPDCGYENEDGVEYLLNSFLQQNTTDFRPLSMHQIFASFQMQNHLSQKDYNRAFLQLANCIEDNGKGLNDKKLISVNEYALYTNLIKGFLNQLEQE